MIRQRDDLDGKVPEGFVNPRPHHVARRALCKLVNVCDGRVPQLHVGLLRIERHEPPSAHVEAMSVIVVAQSGNAPRMLPRPAASQGPRGRGSKERQAREQLPKPRRGAPRSRCAGPRYLAATRGRGCASGRRGATSARHIAQRLRKRRCRRPRPPISQRLSLKARGGGRTAHEPRCRLRPRRAWLPLPQGAGDRPEQDES
mmetsp:Transcript_56825/g.164911  ORF Transcript_56825/g.164911 Transcript_56825/m.164911 type:complete len:201 (-) Transcript_56825:88-690(-)